MRHPVRISVCCNCGHLYVPSTPISKGFNAIRPWASTQYDNQHTITWHSLFGTLNSRGNKTTSQERRAWIKRAQDILKGLKENTRSSQAQSSTKQSEETPHQTLKSALPKNSTSAYKPVRKPPESFNRQATARLWTEKSDSKTDLQYTSNPFLSPLQAEQAKAMRQYLSMAKTAKEDSSKKEKYPWEESLESSNANVDKLAVIRRLLRARTSERSPPIRSLRHSIYSDSMRSKLVRNKQQFDPDLLDIEEADTNLTPTKLYQHLRDHHDRCLARYTGPGSEEAVAADRELKRRIDLAFHEIDRIYKPESSHPQFRASILGAFDRTEGGPKFTPFIYYLFAREGFDLSLYWRNFEVDKEIALDESGCIKAEVIQNNSKYANIFRQKKRADAPITCILKRHEYFALVSEELSILYLMSSVIFTQASEHAFIRHVRMSSLRSGKLLFRSRELIEVRSSKDGSAIPLKNLNSGKLQAKLDKSHSIFKGAKLEMQRLAEIYNF